MPGCSSKFKMSASYGFRTPQITNDQRKKQRRIPKESMKQKSSSYEKKRSGKKRKKLAGWLIRKWILDQKATDQDLDEGN